MAVVELDLECAAREIAERLTCALKHTQGVPGS